MQKERYVEKLDELSNSEQHMGWRMIIGSKEWQFRTSLSNTCLAYTDGCYDRTRISFTKWRKLLETRLDKIGTFTENDDIQLVI